jgi:hypothetical protein
VITEFALPATRTYRRLGLLKLIVENPGRRAAHPSAGWRRGGRQDSSFDLDTEWGDKFRTESGSFIAA